jgi:hypothetical protein
MLPSLVKGIVKDLQNGVSISQICRSRYCTAKDIIEVGKTHLGMTIKHPTEGRKNGGGVKTRYNDKIVAEIKKARSEGMMFKDIEAKFKISASHAALIVSGKRRKAAK